MRSDFMNQLLDEDNTENIILYNENNQPVEFVQVAVIPVDDTVFAILHPVTEMEGVAPDEAFVFQVDQLEDEDVLVIVDDEEIIDAVFNIYYQMLSEESNE